jgi:hypothetical protein
VTYTTVTLCLIAMSSGLIIKSKKSENSKIEVGIFVDVKD